jgi:hypothetical protein
MNAVAYVIREGHHDNWDASLTLQRARAEYFQFNGFGDDGGYSDAWVDFKLGPIPFPFPNTPARIKAVRYHDLHHVLTGYQTDFIGELEISGWEVGSDCADMYAAWVLNLAGFATGMVLAPRRTFAAFVRGCRSKSLYRVSYDDKLLARTVGDMRVELGLDCSPGPATMSDRIAAVGWSLLGAAVGGVAFCVALPLAPIGYVLGRAFKPRS